MSKLVGIMGGTFNPIHNGHIAIAEIVRRELRLDEVRFIPTGDPPHKQVHLPAKYRLAMVKLAIADKPGFTVSDVEIRRAGTSYTYQTLEEINRREPEAELVFSVGGDMLRDLGHWRNPGEILSRAALAAVQRPGADMDAVRGAAERLRREYGATVHLMRECGPKISSTQIRALVREGMDIGALVPPEVENYIRANKLYSILENAYDA